MIPWILRSPTPRVEFLRPIVSIGGRAKAKISLLTVEFQDKKEFNHPRGSLHRPFEWASYRVSGYV